MVATMLKAAASLLLLARSASGVAVELTDANFAKSIEGKNALLWFHAPW